MENHIHNMQNIILPSDLMEEILSRLPVKSLLRFRCVSKSWLMLINDIFFAHKHVNNHKNNIRFILPSTNLFILDCELFNGEDEIMIKYPLFHEPKIWGSCNGLLCVINKDNTICIWNPATRKCNTLPNTCLEDLPNTWYTVYGFGYNEIVRDYEVIEIVSFDENSRNQPGDGVRIQPSEAAIYSLRSKLWRRIDDIPYKVRKKMGVLVNGALHWLGTTQCAAGSLDSCESVIAFAIAGKKFREVPQPCFQKENLCRVNIAMLEGKLCTVYGYETNVEIWVMKDYGARESWIKQYSINENKFKPGSLCPFLRQCCFLVNGTTLVLADAWFVRSYDLQDHKLTTQLVAYHTFKHATTYTESLVAVF